MTPCARAKGQILEGGFRIPCLVHWPGVLEPGRVITDTFSGLDQFPTLTIAAGAPLDTVDQFREGTTIDDTEYTVYLDGDHQIDLLKESGPSQRDEIRYFAPAPLGAYQLDNFKFSFFSNPAAGPQRQNR